VSDSCLGVGMKVKIIERCYSWEFTEAVNDFIANVKVIDIKYNVINKTTQGVEYSALIMYEELV